MSTRACATVIGVLVVLASSTTPAAAQSTGTRAGTSELHLYVGELFGDDITGSEISGVTPELDDDITWGIRYGYNFSDTFGIDISGGWTPTSVIGTAGGDVDFDLTTLDIDAIWHLTPDAPLVAYVLAGVGYAMADLDRPLVGFVDFQPVVVDDDDSFTLNAGVGAKWFMTDAFALRGDIRYRYIDKLVDNFDDSLNTFEVTVGVGWRF